MKIARNKTLLCASFMLLILISFVYAEVDIQTPVNESVIRADFIGLEVRTDVNATCNFSLERVGASIVSIPLEMGITGELDHSELIENLQETNSSEHYKVWVDCVDEFGVSNSSSVIFYVNISEFGEFLIMEDIAEYRYLRSERWDYENGGYSSMYRSRYYNDLDGENYSVEIYKIRNDSWFDDSFEAFLQEFPERLRGATINGNDVYYLNEDFGQNTIIWLSGDFWIGVSLYGNNTVPSFSGFIDAYLGKHPSDLFFDSTSPTLELISPEENHFERIDDSSEEFEFWFRISDDSEIKSCSLIIDDKIEQTITNVQKNIEVVFLEKLGEGDYIWSVKCVDDRDNEAFSFMRELVIRERKSSNNNDIYYQTVGGYVEEISNVQEEVKNNLEQKIILRPKVNKSLIDKIIDFFRDIWY